MNEQVVLGLIHLTDLHLYLSPEGAFHTPPKHEEVARTRLLLSLLPGNLDHGLDYADGLAALEMVEALPELVATERAAVGEAPLLVVHTGDAEAFGAAPGQPYRAYEFLQQELWPALRAPSRAGRGVDEFVEVYGNHDLWPGTFPAWNWRAHGTQINALASLVPEFRRTWPYSQVLAFGDDAIEVIRVNSVRREAFTGGILAVGRIDSHPSSGTWIPDMTAITGHPRAIRLLITHHPLHTFAPTHGGPIAGAISSGKRFLQRFTDPSGPAELASHADRLPIHLHIAGHRHDLDPPARAHVSVTARTQPPLGRSTGQLVGEAATRPSDTLLAVDQDPRRERSISVYHVRRDEAAQCLTVDRRRYANTLAGGLNPRAPSFIEHRLLSDIPLP